MADIREGKAPEANKQPAPKAETKLYTVRGPGSVTFGGETHPAGKELQLTEADALSLGESVRLGKAPPVDNINKRQAGKYRVAEERNIWSEGALRTTGYELQLDQIEARKLGDVVEPVV